MLRQGGAANLLGEFALQAHGAEAGVAVDLGLAIRRCGLRLPAFGTHGVVAIIISKFRTASGQGGRAFIVMH